MKIFPLTSFHLPYPFFLYSSSMDGSTSRVMHYTEATGPCYARHITQSLWRYAHQLCPSSLSSPPLPIHIHTRHSNTHAPTRTRARTRTHIHTSPREEEYYLQMDSHMRFVPGWDRALLSYYATCAVLIYAPFAEHPPHIPRIRTIRA